MENDLSASVGALLIRNDTGGAVVLLENRLRAKNSDRFVSLLDSRFTNPPQAVLEHINAFLAACQKLFDVKAVYLTHNGFVFNNDRWYFDSNAYDEVHDITHEYEWLCHRVSPDWETFTLTGLEQAQDDFRWYADNEMFDDEKWESVADIAELLVKVRFVQLVESALKSGALILPVPIITVAYGFDFFCRFDP